MEVLTLPAAALPAAIAPVSPDGGEVAPAAVDFSALLGTAQVAPAAAGAPAAIVPVAAPTVTDTPVLEGDAAVAAPINPLPVAPAVIAAAAILPPAAAVEPDAPADPAAAAVVAGVNLPTLPKDFVAQKPPRAAKSAADGECEDEATDESPEAPVPQPMLFAAPITPAEAVPATKSEAAAPKVEAQPVTADALPVPVAEQTVQPAPRIDAAPQQAAAPVVADAIAAALPRVRDERAARIAPSDEKAVASAAPAATVTAPVAVDPLAAPAAPQQQPAPVQQPAVIVAQPTIILDDLFVAGASDSAWLDRLASDITTLSSGEVREAQMKLNPRILGDMAVRLEMDGRHARVHFTVETSQAQQMIADGAQRLTSLVEANGLKLDGATVDLDQRRSGGDADRRAQTAEQFETQRGSREGRDSGVAQIVARTRLATATERFA